jgi:hypothetical protein
MELKTLQDPDRHQKLAHCCALGCITFTLYGCIKLRAPSQPAMILMIQQCITTTRVHGDNYCPLFGGGSVATHTVGGHMTWGYCWGRTAEGQYALWEDCPPKIFSARVAYVRNLMKWMKRPELSSNEEMARHVRGRNGWPWGIYCSFWTRWSFMYQNLCYSVDALCQPINICLSHMNSILSTDCTISMVRNFQKSGWCF